MSADDEKITAMIEELANVCKRLHGTFLLLQRSHRTKELNVLLQCRSAIIADITKLRTLLADSARPLGDWLERQGIERPGRIMTVESHVRGGK